MTIENENMPARRVDDKRPAGGLKWDEAIGPAPGEPVGTFEGYADGEPLVKWLDRSKMPQPGDKLFVGVPPVSAAEQPSVLTDERIVAVWQSMPGGVDGWLKLFGYLQFARAIEREVAAHLARQSPAPEKAKPAELTPLDYRAQGREEALAIILAESAEGPFSDYTGWAKSGAPGDEGGAYWKEDELRKLLHIGDKKHDAYDRAEAAYWQALGEKDEAKRELLFVQQAPFYEPLHDFLAKHEAWDLMGDLKRASPVAQEGAQPMHKDVEWLVEAANMARRNPDLATKMRQNCKAGHAVQEVEPGSAPAAADEVRNQALEEAARWLETYDGVGYRRAEAIRALKTTASAATSEEGGA